ncbi:MAG: M18 family aminopeptidase [Immundisolibacteraceae bacterium]|nr:M18 family aminopeptidase [Immundisolibacteraceae bacterium]
MTTHAYPEAEQLLNFIDRSPSPWHATANMAQQLTDAGYQELKEADNWSLVAGQRCFVIRDESSLIAFELGSELPSGAGFTLVAAHTDSPGLRVKPNPAYQAKGLVRLGVEIYGGPILATFTDRDLGLAGRLVYRLQGKLSTKLIRFENPLMRIPNLAIHLNREVNSRGLLLDKQTQLAPLLSAAGEELPPQQQFRKLLADQAGIDEADLVSWELNLFDSLPGSFYGPAGEYIANGQLDNLASCDAALTALLQSSQPSAQTRVCGFFDHEEVGSTSHKGAAGSFMADTLQRISAAFENDPEANKLAMARSFLVSADMAHAWNPAFPSAYDDQHPIQVNHGPVIKINANQRYTTEAVSEAIFSEICARAEIPVQRFVSRSDMPCGSTIGPMSAAALGIRSIDVGNPMWSMHSARESAGAADHALMIKALTAFLAEPAAVDY